MLQTLRRCTLLCCVSSLVACSSGGDSPVTPTPPTPPPPVAVASVLITPSTTELVVGRAATLSATPRDASGTALARAVTWQSLAPSVATVSSSGVVSAVAVGTSVITATSEGVTGSTTITVVPIPVATVAIGFAGGALVPQETRALTVAVRDSSAVSLPDRVITWRSTNTAVATIDSAAVLTARAVGTSIISATVDGRRDSIVVTVVPGGFVTATSGGTARSEDGNFELVVPAAAVSVPVAVRVTRVDTPPAHATLVAGSAFRVSPDSLAFAQAASLILRYGTPASAALPRQFRLHRWSGSAWEPRESAVDTSTRRVLGGVMRGGLYALIEVPRPVATVTVTPSNVSLERGDTLRLAATLRAADGASLAGRSVTWRSSNDAVATVSSSGLITAVSAGGPITVTAESEGQRGTATLTVTRTIRFERLFTGAFNSCALTEDGEAWCWGANEYCETGVAPCSAVVSSPARVPTTLRFREMAPGNEFTCGLALDGAAWCWGRNDLGELGTGTNADSQIPAAVTGGHRFVALRGVFSHVCGLTSVGDVWCWGSNSRGQLGASDDPRSSSTPLRVRGSQRFVQLEVGEEHSCGLTAAGQAWCWGENSDGESGDGSGIDRSSPVAVADAHVFDALSLGSFHSCGRKPTGETWCWGWNTNGQVGDGSRVSRLRPVRISGTDQFVSLHAFGWSTCALLANGEARCWGENAEGELGDGTTTDRLTPTNTLGSRRFRTLTHGGAFHMCGQSLERVWSCWGWNEWGQIGDGTRTNRLTPVLLPIPER